MKRGKIRLNKKGAIELSITTIIVIIIGITLLSLGLVWVRGIFLRMDTLTAGAFETAEGEIGKLSGVDKLLTLSPGNTEIIIGGAKDVEVIIANLEENPITAHLTVQSDDPKIQCVFADKIPKGTTSKDYNIPSGDQVTVKMIVDEKGGSTGTKICIVEVIGTGISGDTSDSLIISVKPKKGIFG